MHTRCPLEINFTARLEPASEGTMLSVDFEPISHGWFKLVFPIFLFVIRRQERANMLYIREALERRAAARAQRVSATQGAAGDQAGYCDLEKAEVRLSAERESGSAGMKPR